MAFGPYFDLHLRNTASLNNVIVLQQLLKYSHGELVFLFTLHAQFYRPMHGVVVLLLYYPMYESCQSQNRYGTNFPSPRMELEQGYFLVIVDCTIYSE